MNLCRVSYAAFDFEKEKMMPDILDAWKEFPKIGLTVDGKKKFCPLREAVALWDSGWVRVEDTGEVLEEDFSVRKMTEEENLAFQARADALSESK